VSIPILTVDESMRILSAYSPCRHESYEALGAGNTWGKCYDCGSRFELDSLDRRAKAADLFDHAIATLAGAAKAVSS